MNSWLVSTLVVVITSVIASVPAQRFIDKRVEGETHAATERVKENFVFFVIDEPPTPLASVLGLNHTWCCQYVWREPVEGASPKHSGA